MPMSVKALSNLHVELTKLNPEQRQAVFTTEGHVLVLAGAGSGKTRVLTLRIAYLILEKNIPAEEIVALTFTNKAAGEMKERLSHLIGNKLASKVFIGTFHSYCLNLLRRYIPLLGFTEKFSLYSETEVKRIFKQIAASYLEHEQELPPLETSFQVIQLAKTLGEEPQDLKNTWHDQFLKNAYSSLKTSMRAFNAVDFDGLLELTCHLFEQHKDELIEVLEKTRYVLIDEYQDSNPMQFKIATNLSSCHRNLFVVGDDDQSIYGWRGARIENILEFPADSTIKLEQNYRSSFTILEAANSVIGNNKKRHSKRLKSNTVHDEKIQAFHAPSDLEEAQSCVLKLLKIKQEYNLKFSDFAILYRSNALSRSFEMVLSQMVYQTEEGLKKGIPFEVYGGQEFFERSEIKDVMAFLRLFTNPSDQEALLRIINVPRKGISDKTLDLITSYQRSSKDCLFQTLIEISDPLSLHPLKGELSSKAISSLASFVEAYKKAKTCLEEEKSYYKAAVCLLDTVNYDEAIKEEVKSEKMRNFKKESVTLYLENLKNFETSHPNLTLHDFIALNSLDEQFGQDQKKHKDAVSLMTLHSSKGLEFEVCFIVGLEDHILPHEKSVKQTSIEEERRLFYVGLTRGKKKVILSMATSRLRNGKKEDSAPSRFIFEIPKELLDFTSYQII